VFELASAAFALVFLRWGWLTLMVSLRWASWRAARRSGWAEEGGINYSDLFLGLLLIAIGIASVVGLARYAFLTTHQNTRDRIELGLPMIFGVSILLYMLKVRYLRVYAYCEILFAAISCGISLYTMKDNIGGSQLIALFGSMYLFVRGFDNRKKGQDKAAEDWEKEVLEKHRPRMSGR
jgi:hypothetical protein